MTPTKGKNKIASALSTARRSGRKYADGGSVSADDMIQQARGQLATQPDRAPEPTYDPAKVAAQDQAAMSPETYANPFARNLIGRVVGGTANTIRNVVDAAKSDTQNFSEHGFTGSSPEMVTAGRNAAMLTMGGAGMVPAEANTLRAGLRPYQNVPDSLMGFPKGKFAKSLEELNYPVQQEVRVTYPDTKQSFEDAVSGLNKSHAIERAHRNWEGADIEALGDPYPRPSHIRAKKAGGGAVSGGFNPERGAAIGLAHQGAIKSSVPGRTDKLNLDVPSGSYIIPADIPSALGQGNTDAGNDILSKMMTKGPYGMNLPKAKAGSRIGSRKSSLSKMSMKFASGGPTPTTPIVAAGGEFVVHPEDVRTLGNGDIDLGHHILDAFVKHIRSKNIKTLQKLKPPKGSK